MKTNIPRFMLAAPTSNSGKTTITCSLLKAFMEQGLTVSAFKSGPDYIDPMFHSKVIGAHSRNLDLFLLGKEKVKYLFYKNTQKADLAILEGAMGYFDGIGTTEEGSAYDLAQTTNTPVILCVNAKGAALSLAALIKGFMDFRKNNNVQGVILNNVNPMTYMYYKDAIEKEIGIPLVGYLPNLPSCSFESRHLGLITAEEISDLQRIVAELSKAATKSIDLEAVLKIARSAGELECTDYSEPPLGDVTLAIAEDKAFCFYYQDALDLLVSLGASLVPFSPLKDKQLPKCQGLILGGGYPEIYAQELSDNVELLEEIKDKLKNGLPCYAECGGFMYLLENFVDKNATSYKWVGAITGESKMTTKLTRFGYVTLTAQKDNLLGKKGESINAHEFHYSDSTNNGEAFIATKAAGNRNWECCTSTDTLYAGYPHMHLYGNISFAKNFIKACLKYKNN